MFYVGLDVASEKHDCCILDKDKKVDKIFSIANSSSGFHTLLAELKGLSDHDVKIGL